MKKLMTLALGMMFVLGSTVVFAQEAPKKDETTKTTKKGKKGGKKKTDETNKDAGK